MDAVPIDAIRVHVIQPDGSRVWLPITESPYLKTLQGDKAAFAAYHAVIRAHSAGTYENERSYDSFLWLRDEIRTRGFDVTKEPIRRQNGVEILDGQHRLAILRYLYGPSVTLAFKGNTLESVTWE